MSSASIIICTRNRAAFLAPTLASLAKTAIPAGMTVQLLVVDNGSTDGTHAVVDAFSGGAIKAGYLLEPRTGQCFARNLGLSNATGEIIVFTDDDVRVPENWLAGMCEKILAGEADAVAGSVRMAPHLRRPWMREWHQSCFEWNFSKAESPHALIGANMAFSRRVLAKVPGFDTDLGPGKLGFGDDVLFALQVEAAGFRVASAGDCFVEHHFDETRLLRKELLKRARQEGRVFAYQYHHWLHAGFMRPRTREFAHVLRLIAARLCAPLSIFRKEGCTVAEARALIGIHCMRHYRAIKAQPRKYPPGASTRAAPHAPQRASAAEPVLATQA